MKDELVRIDGQALRQARKAKDWTQETLAGRANVGKRTIQQIENGEVEKARSGTINLLAESLGVDPEFLSGKRRDPNPRLIFKFEISTQEKSSKFELNIPIDAIQAKTYGEAFATFMEVFIGRNEEIVFDSAHEGSVIINLLMTERDFFSFYAKYRKPTYEPLRALEIISGFSPEAVLSDRLFGKEYGNLIKFINDLFWSIISVTIPNSMLFNDKDFRGKTLYFHSNLPPWDETKDREATG